MSASKPATTLLDVVPALSGMHRAHGSPTRKVSTIGSRLLL